MKRLLMYAIFAVGLLAPAWASAQAEPQQAEQQEEAVEFGIIGAAALTDAVADDDSFQTASENEVGFAAGLQGNWNFSDFLTLHSELLFARRGWETRGTVFDDQEVDTDYSFSYLELPMLLSAGGFVAPGLKLKLMAGPHAALFVDGSRNGTSDPIVGGQSGDVELDNDQVNDLQFGATGAIGAEFEIVGFDVTTDIRYQRNLTNVFDTTAADEVQNERNSVMLESWQATLGFMF